MSTSVIIAVGLLGGLGAVVRFVLDRRVSERAGREFPYGTFTVNIVGAFLLGALVGAALDGDAYAMAGTGLVGGFTTFSTWTLETHRLGEAGRAGMGALNFVVSLVVGLVAAYAGRRIGIMV